MRLGLIVLAALLTGSVSFAGGSAAAGGQGAGTTKPGPDAAPAAEQPSAPVRPAEVKGQPAASEQTKSADPPPGRKDAQQPADPPPPAKKELDEKIAKWKAVNWEELVEKDQLRFLQLMRQKCDETVVDFTATFYKQERIRGKLRDEEGAQMKWRAKPFAVYMKYTKGDKGREVMYVEGKYDNKLLAHPGGLLGPLVQLKVAPNSEQAMKDNLRPITMAGIPNMLHTIVPQFELALSHGELKAEYLGKMDVAGRKVFGIKRTLPKRDCYPCHQLVVFIDCELLIPVGTDSYMWDGQLDSKYRYNDCKLNVGLSDQDFDKKNPAYNF